MNEYLTKVHAGPTCGLHDQEFKGKGFSEVAYSMYSIAEIT